MNLINTIGSPPSAPRVTILPRYLEISEGSPVEFRCEASGNPAPTLNWNIGGNKQINPEVSIHNSKEYKPRGKESTEVRKSQIKGKESENSYQELKR